MRVAIFSDTYYPEINGVSTSVVTLRDALISHGHVCYVVTTNPYSNKLVLQDGILRIPGINLKKYYNYRLAGIHHPRASRIIRSWNLDLIHINTEAGIGTFGRNIAKKLFIPTVGTYHTMLVDYTYYVTKGILDQPVKSVLRGIVKKIGNSYSEFTTPSVKTKDVLRSYGIDREIAVVPNGIDLDAYKEENVDQSKVKALKTKLGLDNHFVFLFLGRVAEEKSIDILITSYAKLLKDEKMKDTRFLIVGEGPNKKRLKELAFELGVADNCVFVGKVPHEDVPLYYALADLFVCASVTETQGLTFIESIASKRLVLCRFDDTLEEVIKEGETGFFFQNENDFVSKVNLIMSLPKEEKEKIISKAYENNQKYSKEGFYENMMEVYKRAIRKNW